MPEPVENAGESIFRTDLLEGSGWRKAHYLIAVGVIVGLVGWFKCDGHVSAVRLLIWGGSGGIAILAFLLPPFTKSLIKEIRVTPLGFTVVRKGRTDEYTWSDLNAAAFRSIPMQGGIWYWFIFQSRGKRFEVSLDGLNAKDTAAIHAVLAHYLDAHSVSELPVRTFAQTLSLGGVWTFLLGAYGMMAAVYFSCYTLGTLFGIALMAAGTIVGFMTRTEKSSRFLLKASAALLVGVVIIIYACDVNVRDTLLDWETKERQLGRPPWSASPPRAVND